MRRVLDEQKYLDFTAETSLKIVEEYRAKYAWIDGCLEANPTILWLAHEDLESLFESKEGREAKYTTEILFRALIVHQIEKTPSRETVIRIAESPTLQSFIRLGTRSVPDFTFLNRAFKAITADTWKLVNEELADYAVKQCELEEIPLRHKASFRKYPEAITADTGFRALPEEMAKVEKNVEAVAVPGRGQSRAKIETCWHHFRAGIEGSISVLKRAFRLSICMYRGFKSFAAAVGMAVFCHNLLNLAPKRAPA